MRYLGIDSTCRASFYLYNTKEDVDKLVEAINSAYEMFDHIAIYEYSRETYKTSYVTYERFIEGIVTATLPIISYLVFPENSNSIKITFLLAIIVYFVLLIYVKFRKQYLEINDN